MSMEDVLLFFKWELGFVKVKFEGGFNIYGKVGSLESKCSKMLGYFEIFRINFIYGFNVLFGFNVFYIFICFIMLYYM